METADVKRLAKVYKWVASIAVALISSLSSGMCLMWTFLWEASFEQNLFEIEAGPVADPNTASTKIRGPPNIER